MGLQLVWMLILTVFVVCNLMLLWPMPDPHLESDKPLFTDVTAVSG